MRMALGLAGLALAIATAATPAFSTVKDGVDAWSRGDYPSALKQWRPAAIAGDADAQFNMGQAYKLGRGVAADLKLAEDWYRKAALQGHVQAEDNYGLIMFQNGDRQRAMPTIQKSAERGEPRAQYVLGTALFNGDMVKKDWPRAYAMMTRASAAGIAAASASLAQMDNFIPLDQRQRGLAIARVLEANAQRPVLASSLRATPAKTLARPAIRKIEIPASAPRLDVEPVPSNAPKPTMKPALPKAVAAAKPVAAIASTPGGKWRVQLGAFGDPAKARALWTNLARRIGALGSMQPYLVKAGAVTRLQAGPLGSQPAADKLCAHVRAAGNACLTVGG